MLESRHYNSLYFQQRSMNDDDINQDDYDIIFKSDYRMMMMINISAFLNHLQKISLPHFEQWFSVNEFK